MPFKRGENKVVGEYLDGEKTILIVDVSTPKNKDAKMLIEKYDWERATNLATGRFFAHHDGYNTYVCTNLNNQEKRRGAKNHLWQ